MTADRDGRLGPQGLDRLKGRLDDLVSSGRVTPEEAARLRDSSDAHDAEATIKEISSRHVRAKLDAAVTTGDVSGEEARTLLERMQAGEHSPALRAELQRLLAGRRTPGRVADAD